MKRMWQNWDRKALIIVDMQNDFVTGSLAVPGAQEIVLPINARARHATISDGIIIFTFDSHPKSHCSFIENGGMWPKHCVKGTDGGQLVPELQDVFDDYGLAVYKGQLPDIEEYSGYNLDMERYLKQYKVDAVEVVGLAGNYCVKATADALKEAGYFVRINKELTRNV